MKDNKVNTELEKALEYLYNVSGSKDNGLIKLPNVINALDLIKQHITQQDNRIKELKEANAEMFAIRGANIKMAKALDKIKEVVKSKDVVVDGKVIGKSYISVDEINQILEGKQ